MDRENAIKYLRRKGIDYEDEEEIEKVIKQGKIYGDPIVQINKF